MSKRYIFFIGNLGSGGAERVVSILSNQMAEQELPVEVLTYYDNPIAYKISEKVKITAVETFTGKRNKLYNLLQIRKYFKKNATAVISFLAPFNMMAIAANLGNKIPIIVADRNDPTKVPSNTILRKLRDFLYMFADGIVVQTKKNQQYFNKIVRKKSVVIYNPINLGSNAGCALECKKEKQFVTAGRLMPQKNQEMMLKAFSTVSKKHPDYQLVIYGEGLSREKLENLIKELGVERQVLLPGNKNNVHDLMKSAEAFVMSSNYEGMPNALIEAMCLGLPCISTKVSGATDLIVDHENGLLTEVGHQEEFEKAMLELIENPELKMKLAENALKLNDALEVSKIMDQWIEFINRIVTEK